MRNKKLLEHKIIIIEFSGAQIYEFLQQFDIVRGVSFTKYCLKPGLFFVT